MRGVDGLFESLFGTKTQMVDEGAALPGRSTPVLRMPFFHRVFGDPLDREFPGSEVALVALGCFWGAEKLYWNTPGVLSTSVGYAGGYTPHPTYEEVCSGRTGHAEAVRVVYDPAQISYEHVLGVFFENHDPTQGMRQGHDVGTQYRSALYVTSDEQRRTAEAVRARYQQALTAAGYGEVTTEIVPASDYWYAEDYHQQYLEANPGGYCGVGGTGVTCPVGVVESKDH